MADNFLERHQQDYEMRKQAWLKKKKHLLKVQNSFKENHAQVPIKSDR